ncbi:MAG: hypothetical protein IJ686_02295 [Bacteroidales bacterium]|nr:hypothetical protein [Bacteroidales bacterium]
MKKYLKYLVCTAITLVLITLLALAYGSASKSRYLVDVPDNGIEVSFRDDYRFVSSDDIKGYINKYYGSVYGYRTDSLNLAGMERMLDRQSAVLKSQVWSTADGIVHVSVSQRKPVMRFQRPGGSFYIDDRACIFPLQKGHSALVPVVDGDIPVNVPAGYKGPAPDAKSAAWLTEMLELAAFMKRSGIWEENIAQITVDGEGNLTMIPRSGRERFFFGKPDDPAGKFARMSDYYRYILPEKGEGYYRSVNVKYDGQVICRK